MDILNPLYLKAQGLIKTSAEPNSVVFLATPDSRRDDKFLTIAVPVENLASVIGALETVAVDGVTITGTGLAGDPLVAAIPAPTAVIIKAAFAQADFATDVDALAAPLGQSLVVTDYTVSGFGGTFTRISTLNSTFLDWAVLATDNTAVVGLYGNAPL